jgi:ankyrin repeat protein/tetratricopeptide (TPR) repeat protein
VFSEHVSAVDQSITALYKETESLRRTLASITKTLQSPSLRKHEKLPLWADVDECMAECKKTLQSFYQKLETIRPAEPTSSHFFKNAVDVFRMRFKEEDIRTLRAQIQSHSSAMQMIFQMITVHISSTTQDVILDELTPQLRTLINLVGDLHKSSILPEIGNQGLRRSRTKLERSAKELASKASAVLSSRYVWTHCLLCQNRMIENLYLRLTHERSTAWSGSQPDVYGSIVARMTKQTMSTGSELGEPLSIETRDRISAWVSQEFRDDSTILSIPEESPSLFREPVLSSSGSHTTPEITVSPDSTQKEDDVEFSDEDELEFELEVAQRYLIEGRKRTQTDPAQAEEFLRKGIAKYQSVRSTQATAEIPQITLEIAALCFEQDKVSQAMDLCEQILRDTPTDDKSRELVLAASFLVAQVHWRRGEYDPALQQCKRTLNGRRRFKGKDAAYFQSVALMSAIYRHRGDEIEALAYDGLLPPEFAKPDFKNPDFATSESFEDSEVVLALREKPPQTLPSPRDIAELRQGEPPKLDEQAILETASLERSVPGIRNSTAANVEFDEGTKSQEQLPPPYEGGTIDLSRLPSAMAARLSSAKALADRFSAYRTKSFSSTASTLTAESASKDESLHKLVSAPSSLPPLSAAEQETALNVLQLDGRVSFMSADVVDHFLWAASRGNELVVRLLLTDWIYHKRVRNHGQRRRGTWITQAVQRQSVDMDVLDDRMRSALHLAAAGGHSQVVKILLDRGASRHSRTNAIDAAGNYTVQGVGETPVECAIASQNKEMVAWFIQSGIDDYEVDHLGWSLLHHAAASRTREIVEMLIDEGLDVGARSKDGTTALHIASTAGDYDTVALLLSRGANSNEKDLSGSTPLLLAVSAGNERCINRLIDAGANVRTRNSQRSTLLHVAAEKGHMNALGNAVFKTLDIDSRNASNQTPLHLAAQSYHTSSADALLALGASVNAKDKDGNTPAHLVSSFGGLLLLDRLLTAGADIALTNRAGQTPLMVATRARQEAVIQRLKSHTQYKAG